MIPEDLKAYIEHEIIPRYASFDRAHNLQHAETVIKESLALAARHPEADLRIVYTAAAYHDTGLCEGRENHHLASGRMVANDMHLRQWFSEEEILLIKEAVEDHRASARHEPRSIYGCIVAEADRIIDPDTTLRRTVQYGLKQNPSAGIDWHYRRFKAHLDEKYGPGGYLRLWLADSPNAARLKKLQALITDEDTLRTTFEKMFEEEKEG